MFLLKDARAARIVRRSCMRCHILHAVSMTPHASCMWCHCHLIQRACGVIDTECIFLNFFCIAMPFRLGFSLFEVVRKFYNAFDVSETACRKKISNYFANSNLFSKRRYPLIRDPGRMFKWKKSRVENLMTLSLKRSAVKLTKNYFWDCGVPKYGAGAT
jgi:hypothetical protein